MLAVGLLAGAAVYANAPAAVTTAVMGKQAKAGPRMIVTQGARTAACNANTVDTIAGKMGCGGTRDAAHREKTTLRKGS